MARNRHITITENRKVEVVVIDGLSDGKFKHRLIPLHESKGTQGVLMEVDSDAIKEALAYALKQVQWRPHATIEVCTPWYIRS